MKEAVVVILDANETMAASYNTHHKSRFDCAKEVCLDIISDLMIRSITHEVEVLVLKSERTHHHFWLNDNDNNDRNDSNTDSKDQEIPFPNIVELGGDGMLPGVNRPHPDLLRQVQALQVTTSTTGTTNSNLRGDFCDGIVVAADALYQRTSGKKYQRRIVLITDAEHKVQVDAQQLLVVLDSLRAMDCRLEVIGMNFESQADYEQAAKVKVVQVVKSEADDTTHDDDDDAKQQASTSSAADCQMKDDDDDDDDDDSSTEASGDDEDEDDEDDDDDLVEDDPRVNIKRQNEKLLLSLTEKTGGFVMAAKELRDIFQKVLGQRLPKSTRRKLQFQLAPGIVLEARFSLLLSKASTPTLKKQAAASPVEPEDDGLAKEDDEPPQTTTTTTTTDKTKTKEEVTTHDFTTIVTYWDPLQDTREIVDLASAYRYGTDVVPMSGYDMAGLKRLSPVKLTMLGYLQETQVPRCLRIGPPYAIAGADSLKSCAAIAALAVALQRTKKVGIATLVKTKDADPILVGIFPFHSCNKSNSAAGSSSSSSSPRHLCMMQLPFRGDVANLSSSLGPLTSSSMEEEASQTKSSSSQAKSQQKAAAADNLIDALMLDDALLDHTRIANPYLRSFHQTVVQRILKPDCGVVSVRSSSQDDIDDDDDDDPMATPKTVLEQAQPALEAFRLAFPLTKAATGTTKSSTGRNGGSKTKRKGPKSYHDFLE